MPYTLLKFLHVGSMFLATALAVGPSILLYLVARNADPNAIRRAFGRSTAIFRAGGGFYGLGLLAGFATAFGGGIDLTTPWLLTAYALVVVLIVFNLGFERWTRRVELAVDEGAAPGDLTAALASPTPLYGLVGMITVTLLLVFVMVVKPALF